MRHCDNKNENFIDYGVGVEKVFSEISKLFPYQRCVFYQVIWVTEDMAMKVNEIQKNKYIIIASNHNKGTISQILLCWNN